MALAFLINPIAGMGGRVALKGTDGAVLEEAIARGATPRAPGRALEFLQALARTTTSLPWITCGGPMGENALAAARLAHEVVYRPRGAVTTADDTRAACRAFLERGAELMVFVGGDGTARDVFSVVGERAPLLGVPSGVKMHSGVFAITPAAAAEIVHAFSFGRARLRSGEIVDEDEEAIRRGVLETRLVGEARTVAAEGLLQAAKALYKGEVEEVSKRGIADTILERMDDDALYIIGPGSTAGALLEALGHPHTLLGVDLLKGRKLVEADATEADIKRAIAEHRGPVVLIVGAIGAQGFVLGRGNLQLSPEVIRTIGKENIQIVAAEQKVEELTELFVDTGDAALDAELAGHWRVLCGYRWNVFLPMRAFSAPK